ncbi:hypothetical protein MRX96_009539 [Rhipicephalus microplus]
MRNVTGAAAIAVKTVEGAWPVNEAGDAPRQERPNFRTKKKSYACTHAEAVIAGSEMAFSGDHSRRKVHAEVITCADGTDGARMPQGPRGRAPSTDVAVQLSVNALNKPWGWKLTNTFVFPLRVLARALVVEMDH